MSVGREQEEVSKVRGKSYGDYNVMSIMAQVIKGMYRDKCIPETHRESLDMLATKMARLMNGDTFDRDTWFDISGYAMLIVEELDRKEDPRIISREEAINRGAGQNQTQRGY